MNATKILVKELERLKEEEVICINKTGKDMKERFVVPVIDPIKKVSKSEAMKLFEILGNQNENVGLKITQKHNKLSFQFIEGFNTSTMANDIAKKRNTKALRNENLC